MAKTQHFRMMLFMKFISFVILPQLISAAALAKPTNQTCALRRPAYNGETCQELADDWGLTLGQFQRLNPSANCPKLVDGQKYCVAGESPVSRSSSIVAGSSIPVFTTRSSSLQPTTTGPTSTSAGSHQPQQSGLVSDCDKFYQVQSGDSCGSISTKYGISIAQFDAWNPAVNSACTNVLVGYWYCVGVPGTTKSISPSPAKTTTTTTTGNGITTPTPIQTGMAKNCDKFEQVQSGDTCQSIATENKIPLSQFYSWNPAVGSSCNDLFLGYYVCVATVGYTSPTKTSKAATGATSTSAGNGITTPTPYEEGMVSDCDKFYFVQSGDTCGTIANSEGVSVADIEKWNPHVGSSCTDLFLNNFICVGVQ